MLLVSDEERKSMVLTRWGVHGAIRESDHLGESSENSPGVLHDHCGILGEIIFYH